MISNFACMNIIVDHVIPSDPESEVEHILKKLKDSSNMTWHGFPANGDQVVCESINLLANKREDK